MAETIESLQAKVAANTAAADTLQATVDAVQETAGAAFAALATQIEELKVQLGGGTAVTQAQLDTLGEALAVQSAALGVITQDVADTAIPIVDVAVPPTV